ncbi:hypothetical protein [Streptomyces sp. NPDC006012]|uniref:hypothetical protein n=1 Tax=Streptomyces sp. NPDC006012 TaxID=3364739 RepID=UPI00369D614D
MGMKDQFQEKAKNLRDQAEQSAREKAGQRGQRGQQQPGKPQPGGKPQPERGGRQNPRDTQDTEREMHDRMDQDYDA